MRTTPRSARKKVDAGPRSAWEETLEKLDHDEPTQAGEIESGYEQGKGGGDKGIDADTGDGGYGGDAVEAGLDEADAQPERPLDAEIHGDPRTHVGASYPGDAKRRDERQQPIGRDALNLDED